MPHVNATSNPERWLWHVQSDSIAPARPSAAENITNYGLTLCAGLHEDTNTSASRPCELNNLGLIFSKRPSYNCHRRNSRATIELLSTARLSYIESFTSNDCSNK